MARCMTENEDLLFRAVIVKTYPKGHISYSSISEEEEIYTHYRGPYTQIGKAKSEVTREIRDFMLYGRSSIGAEAAISGYVERCTPVWEVVE